MCYRVRELEFVRERQAMSHILIGTIEVSSHTYKFHIQNFTKIECN